MARKSLIGFWSVKQGLPEVDKRSCRSCLLRASRSSISVQSACLKEKAKVAKLMEERSMLKKKTLKLQAAEEHLQLDLQIAKQENGHSQN